MSRFPPLQTAFKTPHPNKGQRRQFFEIKKGRVIIGGKSHHFRSAWEANIAAYLEMQKKKGEIVDWLFEPETFWFFKIMRGVRSYKPDFKIIHKPTEMPFADGTLFPVKENAIYIEIKGYMDKKSNTKIKRMKKYYPHIKLEVWNAEKYKEIEALKEFIPDWGKLN